MPTKKMIEVALPLDDINEEASRRKRKAPAGYPTTLHKWWAQRPIAACRAVLFASLIDDPDQEGVPGELLHEIDRLPPPDLPDWQALPLGEQRRQRLFRFIKLLVQWESSNDERVLVTAHKLIHAATGGNPPPVYDPFAGGGSIPLEAQRLGLEAHASDLNPVAVLINKALIEIPPKFAGIPPVNPVSRGQSSAAWKGAAGLAADVRYYGKWMRDEAEKRIGHLYPKVQLPKEHGGGEATVIAWLWARTVTCPNPACGAQMPLVSSFTLSTKKGKEAWVNPVVESSTPPRLRFEVYSGAGKSPEPPKLGRGAKFRCLCCSQVAEERHIKAEASVGRVGVQLMAIVAEAKKGRIYLPPTEKHEQIATQAQPEWIPAVPLAIDPRNIWCVNYGLVTFDKLFTSRQLVALSTFSDLISEVHQRVLHDNDGMDANKAAVYADAVATYLACAISRAADYNSSISTWRPKDNAMRSALAKQAIPMVWDFAEGNVFGSSSAGLLECCEVVAKSISVLIPAKPGRVTQQDAAQAIIIQPQKRFLYSTDPPYYDNISYADLSDFFYVWLRRSLRSVYPDLFSTLLVPKATELVAALQDLPDQPLDVVPLA
jgi:putative DNA methylase